MLKRFICTVAALLTIYLANPAPADAQLLGTAVVVASCGAKSYPAGTVQPVTQDTTGDSCGTGGGGGSGTVTSVGASVTGGILSVSGTPITASGTLAFTVAGTSGGIPYFSSASAWVSSAALTANLPVIGGGAGSAPTVGTVSGNTTKFVTESGSVISGNGVKADASGNLVDLTYVPAAVGTGAILTSSPTTVANDFNLNCKQFGINGSGINIPIPSAASLGLGGCFDIVNATTNTYTITPNGTDLLNGVNAAVTEQGNTLVRVMSNGTADFANVPSAGSYTAPTLGSTLISSGATVTTIAGLTLSGPTLSGTVAGTPTFSGALTFSANAASGVPTLNITGLPFLGSGSTTTPPLYINQGAAPSYFNTAGEEIVINAPSGYGGNFIDVGVNGGASRFSVDIGGDVVALANITAGGANSLNFNGRGQIFSAPTTHQFSFVKSDGTTPTSLIDAGEIFTAAAPTAGASQVAFGGTTAAASNCNVTSPAPTACIVVNVAGTTRYIPYY